VKQYYMRAITSGQVRRLNRAGNYLTLLYWRFNFIYESLPVVTHTHF